MEPSEPSEPSVRDAALPEWGEFRHARYEAYAQTIPLGNGGVWSQSVFYQLMASSLDVD